MEFENKENKQASKKELGQKIEKFKKDQLVIKSMEDKSKIDAKVQKKESKEPGVLPLKELGQTRQTESKIVSFFTKFFEGDESEDSIVSKSPQVNEDSLEDTSDSEVIESDSVSKQIIREDYNDLAYSSEEIEDEIVTNNKVAEEVNESEKKSDGYAFLNLKKPEFKEKKVESDNLVGLLLPLTGEKSAAGNLVINSLRYSMLLRPNQLNFKIYDTKGTPGGAVSAAKQGISNNVKTFIGPIFSDETREVKQYFRNKKKLTFFSLSPDLNNVSENIIVSGQNPNDQMSCITKHIAKNESSNVLLIYHADKYGYVIRNSFLNYVNDKMAGPF